MKRVWFLFLFVLLIGLVSASVEVRSSNVQGTYSKGDILSGTVDVSISEDSLGGVITSNYGGSMALDRFMDLNGVSYSCTPSDCASVYTKLTSGSSKTFAVSSGETSYGGFVLTGNDVHISSIGFDVVSNFPEDVVVPLKIDFFQGSEWAFTETSDEFSLKRYGCYDSGSVGAGPLIAGSVYCETVPMFETGAMFLGAQVALNGDDKDLRMRLYTEGLSELGSCVFNPNDAEGCVVSASQGISFASGNYQVCVGAASDLTDYTLYQETAGDVCGFVFAQGPEGGVSDYSIFARAAKFKNATFLDSSDFNFGSLKTSADSYIDLRYERNCSAGCILPMEISGVTQNVGISNVAITYSRQAGDAVERSVYDISAVPAIVSFDGVLDLGLLGISVMNSGTYNILLDGVNLVSKVVNIPATFEIKGVSPRTPPAGIPVELRAWVDYSGSDSLTYVWDFGDGVVETTYNNRVTHTFTTVGNYSISVIATSSGNLSSQGSFIVNPIAPREAAIATLAEKKLTLDGAVTSFESLGAWYVTALQASAGLASYSTELNRLETAETTAYDSAFLTLVEDIYTLSVPTMVYSNEISSGPFSTTVNDFYPEVIDSITKDATQEYEEYNDLMLRWQDENIQSVVSSEEFILSFDDGSSEALPVRFYSVQVDPIEDGEYYLVIDKALNDINFKDSVGAKSVEGVTVITLNGDSETFEFYYDGVSTVTFFVSPSLGTFEFEAPLDTTCNYNRFCEAELGEDYRTCRSDCSPTGWIIFYLILAVIFGLILYTVLQIWYGRHYENYLFGDRKQLYNILMYVTNARARSVGDSQIRKDLTKQGWSNERVTYIIKKSRGQRTGMFEIIPVGKIMAYFRMRKAEKSVSSRVVTPPRQQIGGNFNKSRFRRR